MLKNKLLSALSGSESALFSDDVFASYLRTGTGADVIVTTGIDMTEGYMLWSKSRSATTDWAVYDSARGLTLDLVTNSTAAQTTQTTGLKAVSSTGHTIGSLAKMNTSGATYVDYVFKKKAKFFDCGTYTGNGVDGRDISHGLTVSPGLVLIKCTSASTYWVAKHKDALPLTLNTTNSQGGTANATNGYVASVSSTSFNVVAGLTDLSAVNASGATYVWYAFAHDTTADGIIQCGSYVGNGSTTGPIVNLGWEPQYLLVKSAGTAENWSIVDVMRGFNLDQEQTLFPNSSLGDQNGHRVDPNATGFSVVTLNGAWNTSGVTYIYLAIRRPNKPPTSGTQVYNAIARTGTGAAATVTGVGFAPDLAMVSRRDSNFPAVYDRLRGKGVRLITLATSAEGTESDTITSFNMDGVSLGTDATSGLVNTNTFQFINHFFRRAPGVFSVLCDTGTGANKTVNHDLGVAPELWLRKGRSGATEWVWGSSLLLNTEKIVMPSPNGRVTDATAWNSTYPTASLFSVGTSATTNTNAATYVTYLWSSLSGVSKVFSYTGNGSSQTIDCGFTAGARFVMILRVTASTAQDVFVWDSTRGIVSGNDPRISLNTTAAEVTGLDSIDPASSGFIINTDSSNINVNGAVYIGLAYA